MPVAGVMRGKCPLDVPPIHPARNVRVFCDVLRIVVIDKLVMENWAERRESCRRQKQTNQERAPMLFDIDNQAMPCCRTNQ